MSNTRDHMAEGVPYFSFKCTNCGEQKFGAQPEMIFAQFEDGADRHDACSKCVAVIKAHNEAIEKKLNAAKPIIAQLQGAQPSVAPPPAAMPQALPPAMAPAQPDVLTSVLTQLLETNKVLVQEIRDMKYPTLPPPAQEKPKAKKSSAGTGRSRSR